MQSLGEKIRGLRVQRGWSQQELADHAGTSQTTIDNIEKGRTQKSRYLVAVAVAVGLPLEEVEPNLTNVAKTPVVTNVFPTDIRPLPIYASAEGGQGQMIMTFDPIDWTAAPGPVQHVPGAFGIYVMGESMEPAYRQGDLACIHPHRPPRPGDDVLISRTENGTTYCMVKQLRGMTDRVYRLRQYNPPEGEPRDFEVERTLWPQCQLVIARINRG